MYNSMSLVTSTPLKLSYTSSLMDDSISSDILKHFGGVSKNSLREIFLHCDELEDKINIIANSPYLETEYVPNFLKEYSKDFIVLTLNIQSLNAKFNQLSIFLEMLAQHNVFIGAICLQETWISGPSPDFSLFHIPNYNIVSLGSVCSSHSGLAIYLHEQFSYTVRNLYSPSRLWEGLFLDVKHDSFTKQLTLCNIYRAPRDTNAELSDFLNDITPIIELLSNESSNVIYAGDINIDLLQFKQREKYCEYFDLMVNNNFLPFISLPTRISRRSATLIDHIFCKITNSNQEVKSGIILSDISDHLPALVILKSNVPKARPQKYIQIQTRTETAFGNLRRELQEIEIMSQLDRSPSANPKTNYDIIEKTISESCKKHLPVKTVKFNKYKHKNNPWITMGILRSIKSRDKLYKSLRSSPPDSSEYTQRHINLKTFNNILNKSIRDAKKNYYHSTFTKYKNDMRKTWDTIKIVLNAKKEKADFPKFFTVNGSSITNEQTIAEHFNTFFTDIGPKLASRLQSSHMPPFQTYLTCPSLSSFNFSNIEASDVSTIISNFKSKTTLGHDEISVKVIKLLDANFLNAITLIINQSFSTGIFPDKLKIAKVIPIFKKDVNTIFDNYRPISILPAISKVFERIVFNQLYGYFTKYKLLYFSQHGFRKLHSTETASIEFIDRIFQHLDKGKLPLSIFIDLSKAFDTIDHNILIHKLEYYGVRGIALNWFKSYLTNRTQYVQYGNSSSGLISITTGVPQGSILGPLLFIIYMNDICLSSSKFNAVLYADDTSLESPLCSFDFSQSSSHLTVSQVINDELVKVYRWLCVNKLSINTKKTKFMVFHFPQYPTQNLPPLTLSIDNQPIQQTDTFNFLGVTIDETVSWRPHINNIGNKISKAVGIMKKLRSFLPQSILLSLYNSLVLPHIYYGILVWGFNVPRLFKLQKKAVRVLSSSKYNAHTDPLFKQYGILKIKDILHLKCLKLSHRCENGMAPAYFPDMFSSLPVTHNYSTRQRHTSRPQAPQKKSTLKSLRYFIPKLLKNTPSLVKDKIKTHSFDGFSRYAKQYYISLYTAVCVSESCYVCNHNRS